eukprot:1520394-Rhodomonas_salina.1
MICNRFCPRCAGARLQWVLSSTLRLDCACRDWEGIPRNSYPGYPGTRRKGPALLLDIGDEDRHYFIIVTTTASRYKLYHASIPSWSKYATPIVCVYPGTPVPG